MFFLRASTKRRPSRSASILTATNPCFLRSSIVGPDSPGEAGVSFEEKSDAIPAAAERVDDHAPSARTEHPRRLLDHHHLHLTLESAEHITQNDEVERGGLERKRGRRARRGLDERAFAERDSRGFRCAIG